MVKYNFPKEVGQEKSVVKHTDLSGAIGTRKHVHFLVSRWRPPIGKSGEI